MVNRIKDNKITKDFKDNVNTWIITIQGEVNELKTTTDDLYIDADENTDNINHNYELIIQLKDEIEELKQEINAIKLIQILTLKNHKNEFLEVIKNKQEKQSGASKIQA